MFIIEKQQNLSKIHQIEQNLTEFLKKLKKKNPNSKRIYAKKKLNRSYEEKKKKITQKSKNLRSRSNIQINRNFDKSSVNLKTFLEPVPTSCGGAKICEIML